MKVLTHIYSRKLPKSIKNATSFDVMQLKHFKIFVERFPLSKDVVMKVFSGGKPPEPHFGSLRLHLFSTPSPYEFCSDGPAYVTIYESFLELTGKEILPTTSSYARSKCKRNVK